MNRDELIALIERAVVDQSPTQPPPLDEHSRLFGEHGLLDSLGLVTLTLSVEAQVNELFDAHVTLTDDRALLREQSPFATIGSFADYVLELLEASSAAGEA
ncbi:MAG TPA: hypothetical protein VMH02_06275 [Verrucomicrobiae bacterium]|nr:hypothetical protein [Verrucomicrobiae bacterium]